MARFLIRQFAERVFRPLQYQFSFHHDPGQVQPLLRDLLNEIETRQSRDSWPLPSVVAMLLDPDRMPALRLLGEGLSCAPNACYDMLRRVLTDGPVHGVHLTLVASALGKLTQVIDRRRDLALINHRVGLQMSIDDSFVVFGNRKAAQLQADKSIIPCAIYANVESNQMCKFGPYSGEFNADRLDPVVKQLSRQASA